MNYDECRIEHLVQLGLMKECMRKDEGKAVAFDFYNNNDLDQAMSDKLFNDSFYSRIIESEDFQRLKHVSFLGAIDYVSPETKSSRYIHSLDVAKLALYISKERHYNKEITDHLVSAALLHDIGHAPLSHSMEQSFFNEFGIDHHLASTKLITTGRGKYSLSNVLQKNVNVNTVVSLIEQSSSEDFSDIFNSKINIDTIDGIHKSLAFVNINNAYNKYALAKSSFLRETDNQVDRLDYFWKAKDFVYKKIITSGVGAIADHVSKEYFFDNLDRINETYFFKKESALLRGSKPIFKDFANQVQRIKHLSSDDLPYFCDVKSIDIEVNEREYKPNDDVDLCDYSDLNSFISDRYEYKKMKTQKKVYYTVCPLKREQYKLFG